MLCFSGFFDESTGLYLKPQGQLCLRLRGFNMAGVVRGGLRAHHSAKHSIIVVGLIVVLIVLSYNYWNISTKNTRLLAEVAKLHKNYKVRP